MASGDEMSYGTMWHALYSLFSFFFPMHFFSSFPFMVSEHDACKIPSLAFSLVPDAFFLFLFPIFDFPQQVAA